MAKRHINLLDDKEPLVSPAEIAKILGITAKTVTEWARKFPDFPAIRTPGALRMKLSEVTVWLEQFQGKVRPRVKKEVQ